MKCSLEVPSSGIVVQYLLYCNSIFIPMNGEIVPPPHQDEHFGLNTMLLSSVQLQTRGLQHARPPCPLTTFRVYSNSRPLSR